MKNKLFLAGMLAMALAFGLIMTGCPTDTDDDGPAFDGSTLAGTTWVAEQDADAQAQAMGLKKMKVTLAFSSDTAGTATMDVEWTDSAPAEIKTKVGAMAAEENGPFTSTYDKTAKTGTYTLKDGTEGTFTVNVENKQLTTTVTEEGEDPEVTVFKLK
jgi:hypothetical protein